MHGAINLFAKCMKQNSCKGYGNGKREKKLVYGWIKISLLISM